MVDMSVYKPSDRVNLYLSSQLMYGVTKILLCQTSYLESKFIFIFYIYIYKVYLTIIFIIILEDVIEFENMFDNVTKTDKRYITTYFFFTTFYYI